jgi:copper(I)-binding protein
MKLRVLAAAAVLVGGSLLAACGSDDSSSSSGGNGVTIEKPWARTSPSAVTMGAAYFVVTSKDGDTLTGASVPADIAKDAQVHETTMGGDTGMGSSDTTMAGADTTMGGEMGMKEVDSVDLPAGKAVAFEPGGYHVMLIDLAEPLAKGDEFTLTLTFEKAGEQKVTVPVRDEAP